MAALLALLSDLVRTDSGVPQSYVLPHVRYLMMCQRMPEVKLIMLGQDPYRTNIYPAYAAAFAYDQSLVEEPTPSVALLEESVIYTHNHDKRCERIVDTMASSYLLSFAGTIVINASYSLLPYGPAKTRQMVLVAAMLRELIVTRPGWKQQKITIISFGSMAQEVASMLASSINKDLEVRTHRAPHPAMLARCSVMERISRGYLGNRHVCNLLLRQVDNFVALESTPSLTTMDAQQFLASHNAVQERVKRGCSAVKTMMDGLEVPEEDAKMRALVDAMKALTETLEEALNAYSVGMTLALHSTNRRTPPAAVIEERDRVKPKPTRAASVTSFTKSDAKFDSDDESDIRSPSLLGGDKGSTPAPTPTLSAAEQMARAIESRSKSTPTPGPVGAKAAPKATPGSGKSDTRSVVTFDSDEE